jgi:AraC-like DNA-binding protein
MRCSPKRCGSASLSLATRVGSRLSAIRTLHARVQLIHDDPSRRWTVSELARAAGYSRSAFASHFRELVGESPIAYVTRTRLTFAASELERPDLSVGEVARSVGYASESAFSRAFTRTFGITPGAYRTAPTGKRFIATSG